MLGDMVFFGFFHQFYAYISRFVTILDSFGFIGKFALSEWLLLQAAIREVIAAELLHLRGRESQETTLRHSLIFIISPFQ